MQRSLLEAVNKLSVAMTLKLICDSKRLRDDLGAPPRGQLFVEGPGRLPTVKLNVSQGDRKKASQLATIGQECFEELALGGLAMARAGSDREAHIPPSIKKNDLVKKLTKAQRRLLYTGCEGAIREEQASRGSGGTATKQKATRSPGKRTEPVYVIVEDEEEEEDDTPTCAICLEDITDKCKKLKVPECGHVFHKACIDQWLSRAPTCPVCKVRTASAKTQEDFADYERGYNWYGVDPEEERRRIVDLYHWVNLMAQAEQRDRHHVHHHHHRHDPYGYDDEDEEYEDYY